MGERERERERGSERESERERERESERERKRERETREIGAKQDLEAQLLLHDSTRCHIFCEGFLASDARLSGDCGSYNKMAEAVARWRGKCVPNRLTKERHKKEKRVHTQPLPVFMLIRYFKSVYSIHIHSKSCFFFFLNEVTQNPLFYITPPGSSHACQGYGATDHHPLEGWYPGQQFYRDPPCITFS